jgi:predicted DNA-binding transcriptional regulator AlpA
MTDIETAEAMPRRMLDIDEVLALVPISRTTLFRMEKAGKFPASTYISANRRTWFASDVAAWQDNLPARRRAGRRPAEV